MNNQIDLTKLNAGHYARKSSESEDRQVLSIQSQIDDGNRIVDKYKLKPFVEVFRESKSAKPESVRPEFLKMISMIKNGKLDAIVCWKADRLARNMTEGGQLIDLLSTGKLKAIITNDKIFYPWDNVLYLCIEFGQSNQFIKDLSSNVKRGQKSKAELGIPHGGASIGFKNDKKEEKGNRRWLVDEERFWKVEKLFKMFLTGLYSAGKLYKYAVEDLKLTTAEHKRSGGNLITSSRIYEILKDPIYAGSFSYGGEVFTLDKSLPRIITQEEHKKVLSILSRRDIPKTQHHEAVYSGFIRSEEGNFMGQDIKLQLICDCKKKFSYRNKDKCPYCERKIDKLNNPKYLSYCFYYDVKKKKNGHKYKAVSESKVTEELTDFIDQNLHFSSELVEWSKKYIHELKDKEIGESISKQKDKELRKEEYEKRKQRSRILFRDEKISEADYEKDIALLQEQYTDTLESNKEVNWYGEMNEIVDLTQGVVEVLNKGDYAGKRMILSKLGSNLTWNGEKLLINNSKSINALVEGIKRVKSIFPEFEPKNYVVNKESKEKTESKNSINSTMLLR